MASMTQVDHSAAGGDMQQPGAAQLGSQQRTSTPVGDGKDGDEAPDPTAGKQVLGDSLSILSTITQDSEAEEEHLNESQEMFSRTPSPQRRSPTKDRPVKFGLPGKKGNEISEAEREKMRQELNKRRAQKKKEAKVL